MILAFEENCRAAHCGRLHWEPAVGLPYEIKYGFHFLGNCHGRLASHACVPKRQHFACLREAASAKAGRAGTNDENL